MTLRPAPSFNSAFRSSGVRVTAALAAALALSACGETETASAPVAPAAAPATTAAAPSAPAATPAVDANAAAAPAVAAGPMVPPTGPEPVAGTDYVEIPGGQPFEPGTGKIEVAEVFGYTCPHCATFETVADAWKAKLPADVKFTPVAAPFGGFWVPYAKAFYTAQTMGLLDKTHDAMFRAIHIERSLPPPPAVPSDEQLAQWYAKHGADPQQFASTMASFATDAKLKRAQQWMQRSGVESTPSLIVNGKYRVIGGKTHEDQLRIAEHLIARERAASTAAPADAAAAPATNG
ncbi:thiol:disulfide interchange protein DsbA/DsbL [Lysobacter korlensis]|uniref:Thiol:disulfide interchange protein DsbA/DsbL n=1 Tax=Lysobacter korlensis TaxID=553636 RepID=A0ABV6RR97_9GAMM